MFPIVVAINIWGASLKNKKILFHSDNQAVVAILVLNVIADSLSRCDFELFRTLCPTADSHPSQIPAHLWNIWIQK